MKNKCSAYFINDTIQANDVVLCVNMYICSVELVKSSHIIGTSNWSGDYFIDTGGVGLIVNQNKTQSDVRQQLEDIFLRDWYSNYSTNVWDFNFTKPHQFDYAHNEL